ncbi:hypothetical protein [Streptomyces uncialis]|uniref:Uncharacterized protein n=1 Tax=Streptomyces uncialis TaxID=1048205 RepID=A0A1Q4VA37_9ACTN|nr:hypothetical protein [Streptomyces uncialis]MCX4658430.1 hypothetical protein [Streptomyces uncialis]OKH94687.1 hypothetical protein AB852_10780 [Streptomyces uncialis]WST66712.1 hypothetical protein OG268_03760 [Streptomyces uncialis]WTE14669.1 hypothetical protein OG924_33230 [Streptomyces uncialis]
MADAEVPEDPAALVRARYALYVETLRARMPPAQFGLLMEVIREYVKAGGGRFQLDLEPEEKELFTEEVQHELLNLLGLIGAMEPGHEDRADRVVARLGDGEHVKDAMSLVPPEVADDPEKLRAMRDKLDTQQHQRKQDEETVEGIARASGMSDG